MYPYASYMKSPQSRMLQAQMEVMKFMNPCQYQALMGEFEGKDREACVARLREIARDKGVDLDKLASQYGISL